MVPAIGYGQAGIFFTAYQESRVQRTEENVGTAFCTLDRDRQAASPESASSGLRVICQAECLQWPESKPDPPSKTEKRPVLHEEANVDNAAQDANNTFARPE